MPADDKGVDTPETTATTTAVGTQKASDAQSPMDFDEPTDIADDDGPDPEVPDEGDEDPPATPPATEAAPAETPPATEPEKSIADDLPDLDPDIYDESIVSAFKKQKEIVKTLESQVKTLTKDKESQATEAFFNDFDAAVSEVGGGFGKGTRETITDKQRESRQELLNEMSVLAAGRTAKGLPPLPVKDLVRKAVAMTNPDLLVNRPRQQAISRPSRSGTEHLTPEQRAVRAVREKLQAMQAARGDEF